MAAREAGVRRDRFGNPIDVSVGYARGAILSGEIAEAARQRRAYALVRRRHARLGDAGIYNLTGLIRAFPFVPGDEEAMRSYVHFIARSDRELEDLALERAGGDTARHDGFLATRVSAGMIAAMLALVEPGGTVVSLVPADRSHPSIRRAVELARGRFVETIGIAAFEERLAAERPRVVVVTAISPSKHHLPLADTRRAIELAHEAGALAVLDDAHMAARLALYDEPPGLALGADVMVWSLDKHLGGPRSGFVAGRRDLLEGIRARALSLGLEAQLGQYIAGVNALRAFDLAPVRAAGRLAEELHGELAPELDNLYLAGAGVALAGEDLLQLALQRTGANAAELAPIEAVAFASMQMLEGEGIVTIPAVGMPGAACTLRIMMYPDGARLGAAKLAAIARRSIDAVTACLHDPDRVREALLG